MSKSNDKNEYWELAYETAVAVSKLEDIKRRCEWLTDTYGGNADPEIDLDEMLLKGARALSSLVIYAKETEDEFGKTKKEKNND
jgi:hypothetical protein